MFTVSPAPIAGDRLHPTSWRSATAGHPSPTSSTMSRWLRWGASR